MVAVLSQPCSRRHQPRTKNPPSTVHRPPSTVHRPPSTGRAPRSSTTIPSLSPASSPVHPPSSGPEVQEDLLGLATLRKAVSNPPSASSAPACLRCLGYASRLGSGPLSPKARRSATRNLTHRPRLRPAPPADGRCAPVPPDRERSVSVIASAHVLRGRPPHASKKAMSCDLFW
jgi:hypothetical protein